MAIFAAWFACLPLLGHSMRAELEDIESQMLSVWDEQLLAPLLSASQTQPVEDTNRQKP